MNTRKITRMLVASVASAAVLFTGTVLPAHAAMEQTSNTIVVQEKMERSNKGNAKQDNKKEECKTGLIRVLEETGFKGKNLRQAWAIVMRESGGRENAISSTNDYGIFQLNKSAHGKQDWWHDKKLLTREYNAKIAHHMSQGGKNWSAWDIGGDGRHLGNYSSRSVYNKYLEWYNKYPCA